MVSKFCCLSLITQHIQAPPYIYLTLFLTTPWKQIWTTSSCWLNSHHIIPSFPPSGLYLLQFPTRSTIFSFSFYIFSRPLPSLTPRYFSFRWLLLFPALAWRARAWASFLVSPHPLAQAKHAGCLVSWLAGYLVVGTKLLPRKHPSTKLKWEDGRVNEKRKAQHFLTWHFLQWRQFYKSFLENSCFKQIWRWVCTSDTYTLT